MPRNQQHGKVIEKIKTLSAYDLEGNFDQVREKLKEIEDENPQYEVFLLDFDYDYDGYGPGERYTVINISGQRPETAKDRRSAAAKRRKAEQDAQAMRKAQFEKLKQEFGE